MWVSSTFLKRKQKESEYKEKWEVVYFKKIGINRE